MSEINYDLLQELSEKPHPLLNIAEDFEEQVRTIPIAWIGEVFVEARTVHHLLDLAGIPRGDLPYDLKLDSRAYLAFEELTQLLHRLYRIKAWHTREKAPGGLVGDLCAECGTRWPCETFRLADGTHEDLTEERL